MKTRREIARRFANHIADNHKGAWAGVMLQVDWMTDLIEFAIAEGIEEAENSKAKPVIA